MRKARARYQRWMSYVAKVRPRGATGRSRRAFRYPPGEDRAYARMWLLKHRRDRRLSACFACGQPYPCPCPHDHGGPR